jgi:Glucosamine-6-phosphate isomerases/6-phosphogluconolactonase
VKIEIYPDDDAVARKAAAIIAATARAAVTARGRFIMAVSGGRTPWLMLRALTDLPPFRRCVTLRHAWGFLLTFSPNENPARFPGPSRSRRLSRSRSRHFVLTIAQTRARP